MFSAAITAFGQVFSPLLRGVLLKSVALAIGLLIVMAIGLNAALQHLATLPIPGSTRWSPSSAASASCSARSI